MAGRNLDDIDCEIREVHGRTFRKLGSLLIEIVDRKLFQLKGFSNVEDYFNSESHLPSARQAFRLISATRFSRQLPDTLPQPKSERQVRPLLGRPVEEAKLLWAAATILAKERNCPIDGKLVSRVVKDYQEGKLTRYAALGKELLEGGNRENLGRRPATVTQMPSSPPRSRRRRAATQHNRTTQRTARLTRGRAMPLRKTRSMLKPKESIQQPPGSLPQCISNLLSTADRPHSKLSLGHGVGQMEKRGSEENHHLLEMVENISLLVSNLAHAWGFTDIAAGVDLPIEICTPSATHNNSLGFFKDEFGARSGAGGQLGSGHGQKASVTSPGQRDDGLLSKLIQKTLLQLMQLVSRMGDPSCMWALWAPGWGEDRNFWVAMSEQQQWCDGPGLRESCEADGVTVPVPYHSTVLPADGMETHAPHNRCRSNLIVDCPMVPRPKWSDDCEERMPRPFLGHQGNWWQQQVGQNGNEDQKTAAEGTDEGKYRLSGIQLQGQTQDTLVSDEKDKRSTLKRVTGFGALPLRQAKVARRLAGRVEQDENGGELGQGDTEQMPAHEIDEMAVAEALLCMSNRPSK